MKPVKIRQKWWCCNNCHKRIDFYPDIKVEVETENCHGENHFCSNKCLKQYLMTHSIVWQEDYEKRKTTKS